MKMRLTRCLRLSLFVRGRQQPINEARVRGIPHHNGRPAQRDGGRTTLGRGSEAICHVRYAR
jgi:hypothetical protein